MKENIIVYVIYEKGDFEELPISTICEKFGIKRRTVLSCLNTKKPYYGIRFLYRLGDEYVI